VVEKSVIDAMTSIKVLRIAFDVGGVLSKYPDQLRPLLAALHRCDSVEVYVISDMHPPQKIIDMLELNAITHLKHRVFSADFRSYGERCKARLCQELEIDVLIDDFPGYLATIGGPRLRLMVMPDPTEPYYHDDWKTDGSEGDFGRRVRPTKGEHPWQ
jgi:hypothetical protein